MLRKNSGCNRLLIFVVHEQSDFCFNLVSKHRTIAAQIIHFILCKNRMDVEVYFTELLQCDGTWYCLGNVNMRKRQSVWLMS